MARELGELDLRNAILFLEDRDFHEWVRGEVVPALRHRKNFEVQGEYTPGAAAALKGSIRELQLALGQQRRHGHQAERRQQHLAVHQLEDLLVAPEGLRELGIDEEGAHGCSRPGMFATLEGFRTTRPFGWADRGSARGRIGWPAARLRSASGAALLPFTRFGRAAPSAPGDSLPSENRAGCQSLRLAALCG